MHSKKVRRAVNAIKQLYDDMRRRMYKPLYVPLKVFRVRHKKQISVVFQLVTLSIWKTELLYLAMLRHPRFAPQLVIVKSSYESDCERIWAYCKKKGYDVIELTEDENVCKVLHPDIVFSPKPYADANVPQHSYYNNLKTLYCYCDYAIHSSVEKWAVDAPLLHYCWQNYYENELNLRTYAALSSQRKFNGLATGLPIMDEILIPKSQIPDPWKVSPGKKRIIFAPHHSINPENWIQLSTFLTTGPLMLKIAEKYSDRIQWAFKPHPLLRGKLEKIWGKEETDNYYRQWADASWSQIDEGEYLGLFKHSDAMIHDCGSFAMEYLATDNPVMFLTRVDGSSEMGETVNEMRHRALDLHYQGGDCEHIERFIEIVISGNDTLKAGRAQYTRDFLTPPGGKSACENIIDAILGKKS